LFELQQAAAVFAMAFDKTQGAAGYLPPLVFRLWENARQILFPQIDYRNKLGVSADTASIGTYSHTFSMR
jgi:hypothetical protein